MTKLAVLAVGVVMFVLLAALLWYLAGRFERAGFDGRGPGGQLPGNVPPGGEDFGGSGFDQGQGSGGASGAEGGTSS